MGQMKRQIAQLEAMATRLESMLTPREPNEIELRIEARSDALWPMLSDADTIIIADWLTTPHEWKATKPALYLHWQHVILELCAVKWQAEVPLAWPAEVAAVYRLDEHAKPLTGCRSCYYPLPVHHVGWGNYPPHGVDYFAVCPVCGADIGENQYSARRPWRIGDSD